MRVRVCVCVCVRERERERERDIPTDIGCAEVKDDSLYGPR